MESWKKRILSAVVALSVAAAGIGTFPQIDIPVYATEPEAGEEAGGNEAPAENNDTGDETPDNGEGSEGEDNSEGNEMPDDQLVAYPGEMIDVSLGDNGVTNEELLANYVQKQFDNALAEANNTGRKRAYYTISAGSSLSGVDAYIYNKIKPMIAEIAAGTKSSTMLEVDFDEVRTALGLAEPEMITWESKNVTTVWASEGVLTTEAQDAVDSVLSVSPYTCHWDKVLDTLLADCPYELYWFDKTTGISMSSGVLFYTSGMSDIGFKTNDDYSITFFVSNDYTTTPGYLGTTTVDVNKTAKVSSSVSQAITNAQAIVTANSTKTTLEKLTAYKNAICARVSYNTTAAKTQNYPYGDPWQLVYVFDNDTTNQVVCEGYSKAFKYLCDLSNFTDVGCILATGTMSGGTGAGRHMWNVVRMDDNKNYLVDVTNCDEGTVGYPDGLFIKVASGSYTTWYSYTIDTVTYTYDDETKANFAEETLTLSTTAYSGASDPVNKVAGISLSLGGEIGLNFYLSVPDANVDYSITGPKGTQTGKVSSLSMGTGDYATCRVLTYRVNATQMNEKVTLTLKSGETVLPLYNGNSVQYVSNQCACSVNDYITAAKGTTGIANLNTLLNTMYTYGAYASHYFNSTAVPAGLALPTITAGDLSTYNLAFSGTAPDGFSESDITVSLVLNDKVYARVYFGTKDISGLTRKLDGNDVGYGTKNGKQYIEIQNIGADQFTTTHNVKVGDWTITVSAMTYLRRAMVNLSANTDLMNLVKATYAYSQAANAYH